MTRKLQRWLQPVLDKYRYFSGFLLVPKSHKRFLTAILVIRVVALFGVSFRYALADPGTGNLSLVDILIRITLLLSFAYAIALVTINILSASHFLRKRSKSIQVALDLLFFSAFYVLSQDMQSDLFLLYFLPLLIAAEYFTLAGIIIVLTASTVLFLGALSSIDFFFGAYPTDWVFKVFIPREFFFLVIAGAYLLHRGLQSSASRHIANEHQALFSVIEKITDPQAREKLRDRVEDYTENVQHYLEQLAQDVSSRSRKMSQHLATIFNASEVTATPNEELVIASIMEAIGDGLDCPAGMLRLEGRNEQGAPSLVLRAGYGLTKKYSDGARYLDLHEESFVVETFKQGRTRTVVDVQASSPFKRGKGVRYIEYAQKNNLHSAISFPLRTPDGVEGTVSFYRQVVRPFAHEEMKLGETLVSYLALTLMNYRMYSEKVGLAEERIKQLQTLNDISLKLLQPESLDSLLQSIAESVRKTLNAEVAAIFRLNDQTLTRIAIDPFEPNWLPEETYREGQGVTGKAITVKQGKRHGEPILENNVDSRTDVVVDYFNEYVRKLSSKELKHLIAMPLNGQEGPFGVLRVMNKLDEDGKLSSNGFSPSDLELLYTIGCMVGIAVENTQLLDDARVRLKELQQLQAATEAIASSLSLDDVLHNIVSYSGLPVSADYVSILIVGDKGELLTSREKFGGVIPLYERAKAQGTTDTVILGKEPVFSEDTELTWSRDASLLQAGVRAYAAFPLIIDSRVLGVLYFHYKVPTRFQNKFPLLKALVNQAAGAVQNARLYQLSQSALNLGQIISSTLKQQSSLQTVVDEMTKLIGIDQAGIVLFDDNKEFGHVVAASEREGGRMETTDRIPLRNNPSIETILSTKRPYPIYDARNDPSLQIISDLVEKWGVQSMLLVPLVAAGEVIGTLGLDAVREKRHFSPEEIGLCQLIATWLATAIKNSTLYEEAQEQRRRLQSFLGTVTTKLVKHTDLEGLYEFIVHSGAGHLNAGNCGLFLNDPEVGRLEMVAWSQSVARTSYAPRTLGSQELSDDLNARVASTGEPIQWVRDSNHAAETELRGGDIQLSASHSEDLNSLLIVPVFSADRSRIIGVLRVENKQTVNRGVGFTEFDRDLLTTLADQVAKDIDLHEDYARMRANAALGERDRLTGDLHEALNLFHSGVMVNADLAEYWLKREEYANVADRLMAVRRVAKFIVAELRHILEDLRDPVLTKSGLVVALEKYTELLGTEWIRFTSNVDVALPFDVSFALFRTAQAALHNAVKHSGVGDRPNGLVDVSLRLKNGYIILRVADNGRGFDLKATKAAYPAPYGLERMKKLAADLGEPLRIITRPDRGTIVVACTPLKEVLDAKQDKSFTC